MASYHPESFSSLPPTVTLEAVMKGNHRYRKERKKKVGNVCEDMTQAPTGTIPCTSLQKSAPPSTIYWQLQQCLQCGIPFNDHLCDRLAPLSPALQAAPRPPLHFPAPPPRPQRKGTTNAWRRAATPSSLPRSPHASMADGPQHLETFVEGVSHVGSTLPLVHRPKASREKSKRGERDEEVDKKAVEKKSETENDKKQPRGRAPKRSPPVTRPKRRTGRRSSPQKRAACGNRTCAQGAVPCCALCTLVRQEQAEFPISQKGEVLRAWKTVSSTTPAKGWDRAVPRRNSGTKHVGERGTTGIPEAATSPPPPPPSSLLLPTTTTTAAASGTGAAATFPSSTSTSPLANQGLSPYYHTLLRTKKKPAQHHVRAPAPNEEEKSQAAAVAAADVLVSSSTSSHFPSSSSLLRFYPNWMPELDAASHRLQKDPTTMATGLSSPLEEMEVAPHAGAGRWTSSSSSSPHAAEDDHRQGREGTSEKRRPPVASVVPPPLSSSLSPLANPFLLGPPFATSVASAAAGLGRSTGGGSGGTEARSRSRSASGVGGRRPRSSSARRLRPGFPSSSASSFPSSSMVQRSLLGDLLRVQQAAEWLSSCPLLTLRVLQQRVLVAIDEPFHSFLGTPWFLLPEKPIASSHRVQRGAKEKKPYYGMENDEEEEEEEESDEEPVVPPTALSFTAFLTQFILVTYESGMQDVREALHVERESSGSASRSKSSSRCRRPCRPRSSDPALISHKGGEKKKKKEALPHSTCAFLPTTTTVATSSSSSSSLSSPGLPTSSHSLPSSRQLSVTVLSESPRKGTHSRHLNGLLSSGRPPRIATLSATDFPYGTQEELLFPTAISVHTQRRGGTGANTPRSPARSPTSPSASIPKTRPRQKVADRKDTDGWVKLSPLSRRRGGEPRAAGASLTEANGKKGEEEEQLLQSEVMHWSVFFEQFFDPSHEGQCRDPLSLYAAILLACAAAGRRVLAGGTDAKLNRELAKHCLYRPDTHCTHCDACDTLRWKIRAHWRCTLLEYRDRLYTAAAAAVSPPSPPGPDGKQHSSQQRGGVDTAAPISTASHSFPSPAVVHLEKEEEEACNMAQGIRFFLGTPTIVWWAVCFLQLYRATGDGTVVNPRRYANAPPSIFAVAHSRQKNRKQKSSNASEYRYRDVSSGAKPYGAAAGGKGTSDEKVPRDTLRPGEVFTICDWITRQAEQEEEMFRLQESVGSVWLSPPSQCADDVKGVRVGFTKEGVLCAVQKIIHWARERVRAGLPLDVQDFLLLLRREFPIVAYYSTFFVSSATCR